MSIRDYLHEKAEESRHNEIIAYMMFLAGSMFFVGSIPSSLSMEENPADSCSSHTWQISLRGCFCN
jgi:hypothetical protein